MRVSSSKAQRDRAFRWLNRAGVVLGLTVATTLALRIYENSQQVRRPASLTIPAAVGNQMRQQQHRFENVIRSIRSVVPSPPPAMPIHHPHYDEPSGPRRLEGDFDHPQVSPFRWV